MVFSRSSSGFAPQLSVVAALSIVSLGSISEGASQTYVLESTQARYAGGMERSQSQGAASAAAAVVFGAPSDGIVAHGTSPGVRSTALSEKR